jgi:hypothetical protein
LTRDGVVQSSLFGHSQDLTIDVSGDGDVVIAVEDNLDGRARGNGTIDVFGSPEGTIDTLGDGDVVYHDPGSTSP